MAKKHAEVYSTGISTMSNLSGLGVDLVVSPVYSSLEEKKPKIKPLPEDSSDSSNATYIYGNLAVRGTIASVMLDGRVITELSNYNSYYFKNNTILPPGASGMPSSKGNSYATDIDNYKLSGYASDFYTNSIYKTNKFIYYYQSGIGGYLGTTLANCVGWAHGRVNELWGNAIDRGDLVFQDETKTWKYLNRDIVGDIQIIGKPTASTKTSSKGPYVPSCNGGLFYQNWPTEEKLLEGRYWYGWKISDGNDKTELHPEGFIPAVGAIVCWDKIDPNLNRYGHVAVVEEVHNFGQRDEYIIISQSGYSAGYTKTVAETKRLDRFLPHRQDFYWCKDTAYTIKGFLYSPVTQLFLDGYTSHGYGTQSLQVSITKVPLEEYIEQYKKIQEQYKDYDIVSSFEIDDQVTVLWIGYKTVEGEKKLENGKIDYTQRVNIIGATGKVTRVDHTSVANCPYGVSLDGGESIAGWFTADSLKRAGD